MWSTALCLQSSGSNEGENIDAPLQDCTIEEQRGVVRFLWAVRKPVEIHRRMLAQNGQSTMSQRKVWVGGKVLNRVEYVLLMVILVGHQHRAAEKLLLRRNTETSWTI